MGAALVTCCLGQAVCTLCSTCCSCTGCCCGTLCGGRGTTPRDPMVGKMRSFGITIASIVLGLIVQYSFADNFYADLWQWQSGCNPSKVGDNQSLQDYRDLCAGNTAIYRVSFVNCVFFLIMTVFAACLPSLFNNRYWAGKIVLLVGGFIIVAFCPNYIFDDRGYVWPARFGAFFFTILQQIVIIEIAYAWNDAWVERAGELGEDGDGRHLLISLVVISVMCFACALTGLGLLFHYFKGCASNEIILSLTLVLCIMIVAAQLSGERGNLLTSAIITGYSVFLAYSAVSKNPNAECNPTLGDTKTGTIIVGLVLTVLSLCWVCLSSGTAVTDLLQFDPNATAEARADTADVVIEQPPPRKKSSVSGGGGGGGAAPQAEVVLDDDEEEGRGRSSSSKRKAHDGESNNGTSSGDADELPDPEDGGDSWKFNIVMALISTYYAMLLTNWGDIQTSSFSSDPKTGKTALWMTMAGQWIALMLYLWSMLAPRMFPDREFA